MSRSAARVRTLQDPPAQFAFPDSTARRRSTPSATIHPVLAIPQIRFSRLPFVSRHPRRCARYARFLSHPAAKLSRLYQISFPTGLLAAPSATVWCSRFLLRSTRSGLGPLYPRLPASNLSRRPFRCLLSGPFSGPFLGPFPEMSTATHPSSAFVCPRFLRRAILFRQCLSARPHSHLAPAI